MQNLSSVLVLCNIIHASFLVSHPLSWRGAYCDRSDLRVCCLAAARRKPVPEFVKAIQELTPKAIAEVVTKILKTAPTVAVLGDISNIPRYDSIASRFR